MDVKLVADSQDNRKGHYGEDNNIYLNDTNLNNTKDLATTLGHETSHAIDNQDPSIDTNPQNNTSKADNEIYAQNYGDDFSDYVEFASENYGDGSLADSNNKNLGNTPAEIQRNQKLINSNNQDYAGIDKSKGENFVVTGTLTAAAIYAAIVGDGDLVDGLETIGQGNDPLTKVIAQGSQAAIELSYEHFPKATENTLDLIAKVGTQVGNGLDVTVKYIDDKTGNVASAKWNKLDKATQDQIRGGGRILSVIVPAGSVRAITRLKGNNGKFPKNIGAKDAPLLKNKKTTKEYIYGPKKDLKINADGSTKKDIWTTPDKFKTKKEAIDKLDLFKPVEGRRLVLVPKGEKVKRGTTPGGEGPYKGSGGARETLIPNGLPKGSVEKWKPVK
ncbi:hypothetical protein BSPWISOXPB_11028 [uncultured Gammaproteobacteria bacterium]|nr:hypothetical protein BSPWISOXPB_11028 [uncultured Gammaproteobacteria bacterium]